MERPLSAEECVHYTRGIGCETDRSPYFFSGRLLTYMKDGLNSLKIIILLFNFLDYMYVYL